MKNDDNLAIGLVLGIAIGSGITFFILATIFANGYFIY